MLITLKVSDWESLRMKDSENITTADRSKNSCWICVGDLCRLVRVLVVPSV